MKRLIVNIPGDKIDFSIELFEKLGITTTEDFDYSKRHSSEVQRRMDLMEKGEIKSRSWDEAKKDIFKK